MEGDRPLDQEVTMLRQLLRIALVTAVAAGALAFAGAARANPSTPQLAPIAPFVFGNQLTVSWSPSTFDQGALVKWYELTVVDFTAGSIGKTAVFSTSKTIALTTGHKYGLRLRAGNVVNGQVLYSGSSVDVFTAIKLIEPPIYYEEIYRIPEPWPCLTCPPVDIFVGDDPVVQRARELVASARFVEREVLLGLRVDARGGVTAIYA
jgi:hypothetical protein